VIVALQGGMCNQLAQWAFGRSVSLARNEELFFEKRGIGKGCYRGYELDKFGLDIKFAIPTGPEYPERGFGYDPEVYTAPQNSHFIGFWQTEKFYNPMVRQEIIFQLRRNAQFTETAVDIWSRESNAFVHVRRGDYLKEPHKSYHGNMTLEYYNQGIDLIKQKDPNTKFFIFSDDPDWCRLNFPEHTVINNPNNFESLGLMTLCKHAIIANSSFGWWGAWLNDDKPGRMIVAPKRWFQADVPYADVVPDRWIKM